jgi:hypothetical protein
MLKKKTYFQTKTPMIDDSPMSSSDESKTSSIDNLDLFICKEIEEENVIRSKEIFNS